MIYPGLNVWEEIPDLVSMNSNWKHMWLASHQAITTLKCSLSCPALLSGFSNCFIFKWACRNQYAAQHDLSHQSRMWSLILERSSGSRDNDNSYWFHIRFLRTATSIFIDIHYSVFFRIVSPNTLLRTSIAANFSLSINDAIQICFSLWGLDQYDIYQR